MIITPVHHKETGEITGYSSGKVYTGAGDLVCTGYTERTRAEIIRLAFLNAKVRDMLASYARKVTVRCDCAI